MSTNRTSSEMNELKEIIANCSEQIKKAEAENDKSPLLAVNYFIRGRAYYLLDERDERVDQDSKTAFLKSNVLRDFSRYIQMDHLLDGPEALANLASLAHAKTPKEINKLSTALGELGRSQFINSLTPENKETKIKIREAIQKNPKEASPLISALEVLTKLRVMDNKNQAEKCEELIINIKQVRSLQIILLTLRKLEKFDLENKDETYQKLLKNIGYIDDVAKLLYKLQLVDMHDLETLYSLEDLYHIPPDEDESYDEDESSDKEKEAYLYGQIVEKLIDNIEYAKELRQTLPAEAYFDEAVESGDFIRIFDETLAELKKRELANFVAMSKALGSVDELYKIPTDVKASIAGFFAPKTALRDEKTAISAEKDAEDLINDAEKNKEGPKRDNPSPSK